MKTYGIAHNPSYEQFIQRQKISKNLTKEFIADSIEYPVEINGRKSISTDSLAEKMSRAFCDEMGLPIETNVANPINANIALGISVDLDA